MRRKNQFKTVFRSMFCLTLIAMVGFLFPHSANAASKSSPSLSSADTALIRTLLPQHSVQFNQRMHINAKGTTLTFNLDNSIRVQQALKRKDISSEVRATIGNMITTKVVLKINPLTATSATKATPNAVGGCIYYDVVQSSLEGYAAFGIPEWYYTVTQSWNYDLNNVCREGANSWNYYIYYPGWYLNSEWIGGQSSCCPTPTWIQPNYALFIDAISVFILQETAQIKFYMFGGGYYDIGGGISVT
jgi:hypothetical protein